MRLRQSRAFLELEHATFRLGDRLVFPDTTWSFRQDEHWAVLGGNGSGKSLLADALRGLLPLVQGELRYSFRPPEGLSPEEAIGHVSFEERKHQVHGTVAQSRWNSIEQEGALKVRNYLSYERTMDINPFELSPCREAARQRFARRARRATALLSLAPLLDQTLLSLSNGERQRVELARVLYRPLRLLILDQPFTGLDRQTRQHFRRVLETLMRTPLRVLLLTARPDDLPAHITHVLHLERCRVIAAGARRKVLPAIARAVLPGGGRSRPASKTASPRKEERTGPSAALVRMRNVTVRYDEQVIFHNLNWEIRAGESWALLGPNGSGKSTLLGLILGDHPQAYTNDIRVFGRQRGEGESVWHLKRRIGWVSPELHLHFDDTLTCLGVVASGFHNTVGVFEPLTTRQRQAARAALTRFGLAKFADMPLFGLSAGLQRMVLLARALVKKLRLLILDEPCQGLDAAHRELLLNAVERLIRSGSVTVIYVTHRPDEIPPAIHRVLRLRKATACQ